MRMLPSGSSQLPGGHHEGVAVKMRVSTLGGPRRPVASAQAPGAVRAWVHFWLHRPSKIFIFTMVYKVFGYDLGHSQFASFSTVSEHARNNPDTLS